MSTLLKIFNTLVLIGSLALITMVSVETISSGVVIPEETILRFQLIICSVFLIDYCLRFANSEHKIRFFFTNIVLLIVSIPYINIISWMHIHVTPLEHLLLRLVPLIRGAYGIIIMIDWMTKSKITTLFASYISTILATTYFASLLFYAVEKGLNSGVTNYWDALWWACMDVTTVGSNIYAVTKTGQILSVVLAAAGMMMFPIFTVYITTKFKDTKKIT